MKTLLVIGKLNDMIKDLNDYLKLFFRMQICSADPSAAVGMIKVVEPDLILISLVGVYEVNTALFTRICVEHSKIPVITVGTQGERDRFLSFYEGEQFENIIRPTTNEEVLSAVCRRLDLDENKLIRERDAMADVRKIVLVVDDNAATLRSIKAMLDKKYRVTLATSGMQAMTSIGKQRPDVILLDYEMPVCDGRQTLEMIRADEELKDIPVIFLTGVNDRENIQAVLKLGPKGYLLKPAVAEKLIAAIDKALE